MDDRPYRGVAALSQSVFCRPEPRNTKFVLACVTDYVLSTLIGAQGPVRFVQVGANDGVRGDPLRKHVLAGGWHGLLIEPVAEAMARLRANYAGHTGLVFRELAIWDAEGARDFHVVRGEDVLSSFSRPTILLHEGKYADLPAMIETRPVPTQRLDTLCRDTGFAAPDLLAVDVEGCDDVVLRSFDFAAHRPGVVLFEHVALSAAASQAIGEFLSGLDYEIIFDRHDCLCLHRARFSPSMLALLAGVVSAAREN